MSSEVPSWDTDPSLHTPVVGVRGHHLCEGRSSAPVPFPSFGPLLGVLLLRVLKGVDVVEVTVVAKGKYRPYKVSGPR